MLPEEKARVKIDKKLTDAGWDIVARDELLRRLKKPRCKAIKDKESDYPLSRAGLRYG